MANTLKLEVGKKYLTRGGQKTLIAGFDPEPGIEWPFEGVCDDVHLTWRSDGTFFDSRPHDTDLVEEFVEPAYRYFRWHADADRSSPRFIIWRNAPGDRLVEGWFPYKQGDEWTATGLSLTDDLLSDPNIIECDSAGFTLGRRELTEILTPKTTEDLTPASRTRIAKLAARIVLADGPVLTVDELAGMAVGELVTILDDVTIHSL